MIGLHLVHQPAEDLRDGLVTVSGGVLVDDRGPRARMPEPGHQFLEACSGRGGQRPAHVPQIMEMQSGDASLLTRSVPDRSEVRPPQRRALGADEDEAPLPRRCESGPDASAAPAEAHWERNRSATCRARKGGSDQRTRRR